MDKQQNASRKCLLDDSEWLPFKESRISDHSTKENVHVDGDYDAILACIIDGLANLRLSDDDDAIPVCITRLSDDKFMQDVLIIESLALQIPDLPKQNCLKWLKTRKKLLEVKGRTSIKPYYIERSRVKKNIALYSHLTSEPLKNLASYSHLTSAPFKNLASYSHPTSAPMKNLASYSNKTSAPFKNPASYNHIISALFQNLLNRFENCVNFIRLSRLQSNIDVDDTVRSFSTFGKVLRIQDHWVQPRGSLNQHPSVWSGATVKYDSAEGMRRTLEAFFLEKTPILCLSIAEHLSKIRSEELKYMSLRKRSQSEYEGTIIIIENISVRARSKMREELDCYGTISSIQWNGLKENKYGCEVCYKSTTNAVAAALALDGKKVHRSTLRTKIKMRSKEMFIHLKLCKNF